MYNAANNASSQLAQAIGAEDTSLTVLDGSSFPDAPFVVSIEDEIIEVGAKDGNTFSALVRGLEGTAPAAHASGARVENRFTAGTYQQIVDKINALAGVRIVEMGSNANGEYVRWENGLQVCFGWAVLFTGDGTSEVKTGTKNLPASFASGAALWAVNETPYWRIYPTATTGTVRTSFGWQAERKNGVWSSGVDYPIHFIAIGRWK